MVAGLIYLCLFRRWLRIGTQRFGGTWPWSISLIRDWMVPGPVVSGKTEFLTNRIVLTEMVRTGFHIDLDRR